MPKIIGMIGGLSPESTITYYEHITRGFYERTGHCPDIVIRSVDLTDTRSGSVPATGSGPARRWPRYSSRCGRLGSISG